MKQLLPVIIFLLIFLSKGLAQNPIAGEVLVMLETPRSKSSAFPRLNQQGFFQHIGLAVEEVLSQKIGIYRLTFDANLAKPATVVDALRQEPTIKLTQLNYIADYRKTPNDGLFSEQWNINQINAPEAWDITTGGLTADGDTIVVLVIDNGLDMSHEDLQQNIWTNRAEIPDDGLDNDNNGYIDDYYGWNFTTNSDNHQETIFDYHGTPVVGIIGARGDNETGIAGINWAVKIMMMSSQTGAISDLIKSYDYALNMRERYDNSNGTDGAFVVATNLSAGISNAFPNDFPVWCAVYDSLGARGVLSVNAVDNQIHNIDVTGDMPTHCPSSYLIAVTDTDRSDQLRAAYGKTHVDLAAPGAGCYSITPSDGYNNFGGTSCASPHVAGAIALMYALPNPNFISYTKAHPSKAAQLVKQMLLEGRTSLAALANITVAGGRLDLFESLSLLDRYFEGYNENFDLVNLSPNPVSDELTIQYQSPEVATFDLLIYNALGQLMTVQPQKPEKFGFKTIKIDVSAFQRGIYFLILRNGTTQIVQKFVVH